MGLKLLHELADLTLVKRLRGLDAQQVKNAFFANFLSGVLLHKLQDLPGLALLNDHTNAKLAGFTGTMTDITFWGRALFNPTDPLVAHAMQPGQAAELEVASSKISTDRSQQLISTVMQAPDEIAWPELMVTLVLLKHRFELNSSYFDKLVAGLFGWDKLTTVGKQQLLNTAFMYLTQADANSRLLARLGELNNCSMLHQLGQQRVVSVCNLAEEGEAAGTSTANIASGDAPAITNSIISRFGPDNDMAGVMTPKDLAPWQADGKAAKRSKLRKRNFKLVKFKKPTKEKQA